MSGRVTQSRRIERAGVNALRALLEDHDQIVQEIDGGNDYGEDLFVMLTKDGERTGVAITIQVKSGNKYKRAHSYAIPVEGHANDWKNGLLTVLGVVFDVATKQLFWANLTECLESSEEAPSWIAVPREQELNEDTTQSFLALTHKFVEARSQRRIEEASLQVTRLSGTSGASPSFVGRKREQQAIRDMLTTMGRRVLVSGMAGVGKTSLVDQVARHHDVSAVFSGGVIVADMHGFSAHRTRMASPGIAYGPLLSVLGAPGDEIPRTAEGQAALYHRTLDALDASGNPVLMVFDNVAELSQVAELLPRARTHGVVLTSRSRLGVLEGIETINLDCLSPEESNVLLTQILGSEDQRLHAPDPIHDLCTLCGHLPLALSISAAILKDDVDLTTDELLAELREEKSRLDVLHFGDTAVRAALQVSLARLDCAMRDPFCRLSIHPGSEMSEQAASAVLGVSVPQTRSLLRRLSQASLISRSSVASRWRMHDLVYLFAAEQCEATVSASDRQQAFSRLAEVYCQASLNADLTLRGTPEGNPPQFQSIIEALSWLDLECANLQASARFARDADLTEHAYSLSMHLIVYLDLRGRITEGLQSAQIAYEAARKERDAERQVRALNNIGINLTSQGKLEDAVRTLRKAAAIAERIRFLDGQCDATVSLGAAVRQHISPRAAIPILIDAVKLSRENRDPNDIGASLTNLGSAYRESGLLHQAAAALSASIPYHRASGNRRQEASAHAGLGVALSQLGQQEKSEECFQKAFTAYREVQDEAGIHLNYINLGHTQLKSGKIKDARDSLHRARRFFRRTSHHHFEANSLGLLGAAEWMSGDIDQAQIYYEEAIRIFRGIGLKESEREMRAALREMLSGRSS
ncbi:tetratricopeptide repeat protein [Streptomyces sp. NBC_01334]|uniref:tetratricopeptide repeat protein n=1 Tax=Streptomyces sp. NBC_01334 TaxID=2903827 RepID=UPI002E13150F|nr:tetratricopeptide repeat protein [Streptomyces sp. NBC_01334]